MVHFVLVSNCFFVKWWFKFIIWRKTKINFNLGGTSFKLYISSLVWENTSFMRQFFFSKILFLHHWIFFNTPHQFKVWFTLYASQKPENIRMWFNVWQIKILHGILIKLTYFNNFLGRNSLSFDKNMKKKWGVSKSWILVTTMCNFLDQQHDAKLARNLLYMQKISIILLFLVLTFYKCITGYPVIKIL